MWSLILVKIITNKFNFSYYESNDCSRVHELFTDVSRECFLFFPGICRVKQVHTHKGPPTSLCSFIKAPSVEFTHPSPQLFHQKNTAEKISSAVTVIVFSDICVYRFPILVSVDLQKCKFVLIYLETWGSTQPYVGFWTLECRSCFFVFGGTHPSPNSLT